MFGGVERHSSKKLLVAIPDISAGTLMAIVEAWIETGITVKATAVRRTEVSARKVIRTTPTITALASLNGALWLIRAAADK